MLELYITGLRIPTKLLRHFCVIIYTWPIVDSFDVYSVNIDIFNADKCLIIMVEINYGQLQEVAPKIQ